MKKIDKLSFFIIISIIIMCFCLPYKYMQNDTFYIIKLGELISKNGIDFLDHYCWVANLPYTYPHWLYDIVIYFIYNKFGYYGIHYSIIICFIFLIFVIYYVNYKTYYNRMSAFIVSILSIIILNMFMVARSQIVSLPLFILEVYFINKLIKTGKNKYILYLCFISFLIANIHATVWLFTFILFLPFIGEQIFYKISKNKFIVNLYKLDKIKNHKVIINRITNFNKVIFCLFLCFLMGLLSPSRICYTYIFRIMAGSSQMFLSEHLPLIIIEHKFYIFLIFLFIVLLFLDNIKIYLRELFMISGLLLMCLISTRHLCFFYTIGFLYIMMISIRYLEKINDNTFNILESYFLNSKLLLLLFLILIVGYSFYSYNRHSDEVFVSKKEYPVDAVKYIKNNLDYKNIRLYNEYNYGSYLLFNDIPVFIDSRCDLYLKEFNDMEYSIFDDMSDIEYKYEKKFDKYNVSHVILNKNTPFYLILDKDSNYKKIYDDKNFILFERNGN